MLILLSLSIGSVFAKRFKRPMVIHRVKKMGLEIWTEMEPEWKTELMMSGNKPVFVAHTPGNVYPPAGMTWMNYEEVILKPNEFPKVANSILQTAARNYGLTLGERSKLKIKPTSYGSLHGYEALFVGTLANGKKVDVKIFAGKADQKGPVTMQAYTNQGKMFHLNEQIRRSWSHTRYLNE